MSGINSIEYYESNQTLLGMLNKSKGNKLINQIIENNELKYQQKMESMGYGTSNSVDDKYKAVDKSASNLLSAMSVLENSKLYEADGNQEYDKSELIKGVNNLVTAYNNTVASLTSCGGVLYNNFSSELSENFLEYADGMSELGITISSDGKMVVDQEKLLSCDVDTIKNMVGPESEYVSAVKESITSMDDIINKALAYNTSNYTSSGTYLNF